MHRRRNRKGSLQLPANFIVILIICIVIFISSIYIVKKFFSHADQIKMVYDERTEQEIERLLDDGSRIAIPFDKKTITNGDFETFGIGVLNMLNTHSENGFRININFSKAYDKGNNQICTGVGSCGPPNMWLRSSTEQSTPAMGLFLDNVIIKNNEQEKLLLGVSPKDAPPGTYIFDIDVGYFNNTGWPRYDTTHKIYVQVP